MIWILFFPIDADAVAECADAADQACQADMSLLQLRQTTSMSQEAESQAELSDFAQTLLDRHNRYRCMHGVPLLTWSSAVANNAQKQANAGKFAHSSGADRTIDGQYHGENLWAGSMSNPDWASGVDSWYNEVKYTSGGRGAVTSFDGKTGHYTQVVWKNSKTLGCATGTVSQNGWKMLTCQYGPGGNYGNQYSSNVFEKSKSESECSSGE